MTVGEINKNMMALLGVLLMAAIGYVWYTMLYKPAVENRNAATASEATAQADLATANSELAAAEQQLASQKAGLAKPDDSVSRAAIARTAVPDKELLDDATVVLKDFADRAGVQAMFSAGSAEGAADSTVGAGSTSGAVPIDLTLKAAGTYDEMVNFMTLVESTIEVKGSSMYSRGRLFNVVSLETGADAGGSEEDSDFVLGKYDMVFTVVIRMYTSSAQNSTSVGEATEDPAATDGAATTDTTAGVATDPATATTPAGASVDPATVTSGSTTTGSSAPTSSGSVGGADPTTAGAGSSSGGM